MSTLTDVPDGALTGQSVMITSNGDLYVFGGEVKAVDRKANNHLHVSKRLMNSDNDDDENDGKDTHGPWVSIKPIMSTDPNPPRPRYVWSVPTFDALANVDVLFRSIVTATVDALRCE